jgi:hypothetical protein
MVGGKMTLEMRIHQVVASQTGWFDGIELRSIARQVGKLEDELALAKDQISRLERDYLELSEQKEVKL